jgi:hypothetical protein
MGSVYLIVGWMNIVVMVGICSRWWNGGSLWNGIVVEEYVGSVGSRWSECMCMGDKWKCGSNGR